MHSSLNGYYIYRWKSIDVHVTYRLCSCANFRSQMRRIRWKHAGRGFQDGVSLKKIGRKRSVRCFTEFLSDRLKVVACTFFFVFLLCIIWTNVNWSVWNFVFGSLRKHVKDKIKCIHCRLLSSVRHQKIWSNKGPWRHVVVHMYMDK